MRKKSLLAAAVSALIFGNIFIAKAPCEQISASNTGPFNVSEKGFIKDWLICGPFPNPGNRKDGCKGWATDFLVKHGGEEKINPYEGMIVKTVFPPSEFWDEGEAVLKWRVHHSKGDDVNLGQILVYEPLGIVFTPAQYIGGYAFCYVKSPEERNVKIGIGSDDDYKVWLNHKYIDGARVFRGAKPDQNIHKVVLKKGLNSLLVKCDSDIDGFNFFLRFLDTAGKPVTDITILLPVEKK